MLKHQAKPPPPQWGGVFPKGIAMTYEQQQEAWRDEQRMLRYSCLTDDEYGRRDIQREKRLDEQIEAAYAEIAKDERKARVLFDAINRIANTDSRYGNQMREIAAQAFDEVTQ